MSRQKKVKEGQLQIDWHRGTRKALITNLIIPGLTVRQSKRIIDLLKAVETFARDGLYRYLKAATVAKEMKCSERTVFRAIEDCVELGLLKFEASRDSRLASKYEIDWGTIKQMIVDNPKTIGLLVPHEEVTTKRETAEVTHDTVSGTYDTVSDTHDTVSATYDTVSEKSDDCTTYRVRAVLNHDLNHVREPEIEPCSSSVLETIVFTPESNTGGWGRKLHLHDFQNRDSVQRLWEHAVKFKFVLDSPSLRLRFFTLAKYVSRMTVAKRIRDPGAYFTAQVVERNWLGDHEDTRAAISAITALGSARNSQ